MREYYEAIGSQQERKQFVRAFLLFTNSLFEKHIIDHDYNAGNILTYKAADGQHFALIDINRLKTGRPTALAETKALTQLGLTTEEATKVLTSYAGMSHQDFEDLALLYLLTRRIDQWRAQAKRKLKRLIDLSH